MITEDQREQQCRGWFREGCWATALDPDIAHDGTTPERASYREVVPVNRHTHLLTRLNPSASVAILEETDV